MKVKLLSPICGPEGSFAVGTCPDLSEALALALIRDGHAKNVGAPEPVAEPLEPAVADEVVQTVKQDQEVPETLQPAEESEGAEEPIPAVVSPRRAQTVRNRR
jgi:hypothetical protein